MSVNGITIEVGQSWRTRDGKIVTIAEPDDNSGRFPVIAMTGGGGFSTYTRDGCYSSEGESCHDLIELMSNAKVEISPEPYGMVEWPGGDLPAETKGRVVKVQYRNGCRIDNMPAEVLDWSHSGGEGDIVGYRVQKATSEQIARLVPTAPGLLDKAAAHMRERAATYDSPGGERSMAKTVALFNLHHDTTLTEAQGWHFMQILKDVRLFSAKGYHADSAEDKIAYAALMSEAKAKEGAQ